MRSLVGSRRPQVETVEGIEEIVSRESDPPAEKIYVAVGKDLRESAYALLWALKNLQAASIILLHIHVPPLFIPSGTGNIPVKQARREVMEAYKKNEERELDSCMDKYLRVCTRAKVKADTLIVPKPEVSNGIVEIVSQMGITKLVMGTSSTRGGLSKRLKIQGPGKVDYVRKHAINSCDVLIVCKENLVSEGKGSAMKSNRRHNEAVKEKESAILDSKLKAAQQKLAEVEEQNHRILQQKEAEIKQLQDCLRNSAIAETDAGTPHTADDANVSSCFFCPIFKEIMQDPCVAADGFTYEKEAIQEWFNHGQDISPMTNIKLENMTLISNHSLRLAILQWQERRN